MRGLPNLEVTTCRTVMVLAKRLTVVALLLGFIPWVEAAEPSVYRNEDGSLTFDVFRSCKASPCDILYQGVRIRVDYSDAITDDKALAKIDRISTNVGIKSIFALGSRDNPELTAISKGLFHLNVYYNNSTYHEIPIRQDLGRVYSLSIQRASNGYNWVKSVTVDAGSFNLPEDLKVGTTPLYLSYKNSLDRLLDFESNAKGSDRRHLQRLKETLAFTLTLMADSAGNPILPVTHVKITEQSRMILVLSTVMKELLEDYSAATAEVIKMPVAVLMQLPDQIRGAYGWNTGLAGSGSTATAALAEIFDTELQELYYAAASFGGIQGLQPEGFQKLMTATGKMAMAARTNNGGDAAIGAHLHSFSEAWNSDEWQAVLTQLINAPRDRFQLVQPKLSILLKAAESYSDFVDPKGRNGLWLKISDEIKNKMADAEKTAMKRKN